MKFRKKQVVIEAWQWFVNGDVSHAPITPIDADSDWTCARCGDKASEHGNCKTLEGFHIVCPNDWIIKGVKGEFYPCKPDIFEMTYEPVNAAPTPPNEPVANSVEKIDGVYIVNGHRFYHEPSKSDILWAYTHPAPPNISKLGRWTIDSSTGTDILMLDNCSVIEDKYAHYIMGLLKAEIDKVVDALEKETASNTITITLPVDECERRLRKDVINEA